MSKQPRLITIPFSHFCEKARWALAKTGVPFEEDGHLPLFHYVPVRAAGGSRTVPFLVAGKERVADSTDIIAWCDAKRPGSLLPTDARDRDYALSLEDDFDRELGPATRRWAYHQLMPRKDLDHLLVKHVPAWQRATFKLSRPVAVAMLRRNLKIDDAGAERSRVKIDDTFARVATLLRDGRRYLVGNRFTVADLTFAALAAPVVLPPEHPIGIPATIDDVTGDAKDQMMHWRASIAGQYALRLYATERA